MRNMKALGLASNSRVRILRINTYSIVAVTLDTDNNRKIIIPRIRFKFKLQYASSFYMIRIQFPLRLAYAMTSNRSQGQSTDYLGYDLTDDAFTHGQNYVPFSRVRRYDRIRLLVRPECILPNCFDGTDTPTAYIKNIIYPSIILHPQIN